MATPFSVLLGGYVIEWIQLVPTLLIVGSLHLLTTLSLIFNPTLKLMDASSNRKKFLTFGESI